MTKPDDLHNRADDLEKQASDLRKQAHAARMEEGRARPLAERLIYAAYARCQQCGAGLAYDEFGEPEPPFRFVSEWKCSAEILGQVQGHDTFPFSLYEIKSEEQPSANGATTRPTLDSGENTGGPDDKT